MQEKVAQKSSQHKKTPKIALKQPRAFWLALLIVVVLLTGLGLKKWGMGSKQSAQTPAGEEQQEDLPPSKGEEEFVLEMIPHHQEAIDSSRYIVEHSDNPELKQFAQKVIDEQSKEVWALIGFYQLWFGKTYPGDKDYMQMMPDLSQLSGREMDRLYIQSMMDHHQEALRLARAVLQITPREEIKSLANTIIVDQAQELVQLNDWLKQY